MLEDLIFTECAKEFIDGDIPTAYEDFKQHYDIRVFILKPTDFGDPVDRTRMWCAMAKKGVVNFNGMYTLDTFLTLLGRKVEIDPDALFNAPMHIIEGMRVGMARKQCCRPDADFRACLDGSRRGRLDAYEAIARDRAAGAQGNPAVNRMYFDLESNPDARLRLSSGKVMTSMTTTSLWIRDQERPAHPFEMLELNGVPLWPEGDAFPAPWAESICPLTTTAWLKLVGNSQHLPTLGNVIASTLACAERSGVGENKAAQSSSGSEIPVSTPEATSVSGLPSLRTNSLRYIGSCEQFDF